MTTTEQKGHLEHILAYLDRLLFLNREDDVYATKIMKMMELLITKRTELGLTTYDGKPFDIHNLTYYYDGGS
jgi:hypothetical protein